MQRANPVSQPSFQMPPRQPQRRVASSADQIRNRFRLSQIHPPVQKRPFRELARIRQTAARLQQRIQRQSCAQRAAVALQFHDILPRVAVRPGHPNRKTLRINQFAIE